MLTFMMLIGEHTTLARYREPPTQINRKSLVAGVIPYEGWGK